MSLLILWTTYFLWGFLYSLATRLKLGYTTCYHHEHKEQKEEQLSSEWSIIKINQHIRNLLVCHLPIGMMQEKFGMAFLYCSVFSQSSQCRHYLLSWGKLFVRSPPVARGRWVELNSRVSLPLQTCFFPKADGCDGRYYHVLHIPVSYPSRTVDYLSKSYSYVPFYHCES